MSFSKNTGTMLPLLFSAYPTTLLSQEFAIASEMKVFDEDLVFNQDKGYWQQARPEPRENCLSITKKR